MPRKHITQDEAHQLKRRVDELERVMREQRNAWLAEWPGGVNIAIFEPNAILYAKVDTARRLGRAVVIVADSPEFRLFALPLGGA